MLAIFFRLEGLGPRYGQTLTLYLCPPSVFNVAFTALPIMAFAIQEQNYPKNVLLAEPGLYRNISNNR